MGLMSLLGKGPLSEKKIAKISKLACNPFAQPDVRMREMQRLLDDGSDAALKGVLKRFDANAHGHIADEDEKKWLVEQVVERGEAFAAPLENYIRTSQKLSYALRAYTRLKGSDAAVDFFVSVLEAYGPEDYRGLDAKLEIVWQLAEALDNPRVLPALMPFIGDHSDDVAWAVLDLIDQAADRNLVTSDVQAAAAAALGIRVTDDATGPRILQRSAELLCKRSWSVPGDAADTLAPGLDDTYFLDKKRFLRRRAKRSQSST